MAASATASGQGYFSSEYPVAGGEDSRIYHITKTPNNKVFTTGVVSGQTPPATSTFPSYKDWRILSTNLDGDVIFSFHLQTNKDDRAFEAVARTLTDMMVVGHTGQGFVHPDRVLNGLPLTQDNASACLIRVNAAGGVVVNRKYEMGGLDDHAYSIVKESISSYLVMGRSYRQALGTNVITFMNVDDLGNVLNASMLRDNASAYLNPRKMIRTSDGGFLIAAIREVDPVITTFAPDPLVSTLIGDEVVMIKLDAARNLVFATAIEPQNAKGIGVKDLVEDGNTGKVYFVGTSAGGDYIMAIDNVGAVIQAARFSVGPNDMQWEPKCIAKISNGFVVSGSVDGVGIPRVVVSPALGLIEAKRHQFGDNVHSMAMFTGSVNYLAGTDGDATIAKYMFANPTQLCALQTETVTMGDFHFSTRALPITKEAIEVTLQVPDTIVDHADVRVDFCLPPVPKMAGLTETDANTVISVSPNPAQDQLQVFVPGEAPAAYTLHDLQGRLLASGTLRPGSQTLPVADFARGVYVLRVTNDQLNSTHRISLQH